MYVTIGELFEQTVNKYKNKEAIVDKMRGVRSTFEEWNVEVNQLAHAMLASGVRKGDRVSTLLFNCFELGTAYFAAAKIGAIINPINFRLKPDEIPYILMDAAPKIVIFEKELEGHITKIHDRFPTILFWSIDETTSPYASSYQDIIKLFFYNKSKL